MNLIKKYSELNKQIKIVFWFTFVGFLQKGISLITTPIFTRVLSVDDYGLFSVFNAYNVVLVIVATLYLHMGVLNNALTKLPNSRQQIVSSFQSLSLVVSVGFLVLAFIFRQQLANIMGLPTIIVILMFVGFVFKEPYQIWIISKRYNTEYIAPVILTVIVSILTPVISLIAIFSFDTMQGEARIISYVIVNSIIPGAILYFANYKKDKTFYNKALWSYAISFNLPLLFHYLSETLLNQTDRIMINVYYGSAQAGIYSVAYSAAALVTIFSSAMNTAIVPWTYKKLKDNEFAQVGKITNYVLIFLAVILSAMIMFAPEVIFILAGNQYTGAVYLIPTLATSVYFGYMYQIFSRVELYFEKKSYTVIATITATALNIILNIWWLPIFGYQAAGYSTLISHIVFCVMHYVFYRKICKDSLNGQKIYNEKILVIISISILLLAFLMTLLYSYFILRIVLLAVGILAIVLLRKKIIMIFNIIREK